MLPIGRQVLIDGRPSKKVFRFARPSYKIRLFQDFRTAVPQRGTPPAKSRSFPSSSSCVVSRGSSLRPRGFATCTCPPKQGFQGFRN